MTRFGRLLVGVTALALLPVFATAAPEETEAPPTAAKAPAKADENKKADEREKAENSAAASAAVAAAKADAEAGLEEEGADDLPPATETNLTPPMNARDVAKIALLVSLLVSLLTAGIVLAVVRKWVNAPRQGKGKTASWPPPPLESPAPDSFGSGNNQAGRHRGPESFQQSPAARVSQPVSPPPQPDPVVNRDWPPATMSRYPFDGLGTGGSEPPSPPPAAPVVPPAADTSGQRAAALARGLTQLASDPALTTGSYDQLVAEYGELHALQAPEAEGGHWRVIDGGNDRNRRLSALVFHGTTDIAIIPSLRFLRDFSQTYKDKLEAGDDVRALFECRVDGGGLLQVQQLATAKLYSGDIIADILRGELGGFVR
jgi:hypothetical protein